MKKHISLILAISQNGVYAKNGQIPWYIPEDLRHFKEKTKGTTVVMGRLTHESLPTKNKLLPGRENIVISANSEFTIDGAVIANSVEEAISKACNQKIFFIGGANIWSQAVHFADEIWVTVVSKLIPIFPGTTLTATRFLRVEENWPEFQLRENVVQRSMGIDALNFEIRHWVRNSS